MEQAIEYWRAFVTFADAHPLVTWGIISAILSTALAERSRVDAWAERHPRIAALLKVLRAVGVDPWHLVAAGSLLVSKRLPPASKRSASLPTVPPATMLCLAALLLIGCSAGDLTEPTAETSEALQCPKSVSCNASPPGYDYFVYAQDAGAGSAGVRCWWRNTQYQMTNTIVSDGGCPNCCPSGYPPQQGGCQSVQYATAWTCRS